MIVFIIMLILSMISIPLIYHLFNKTGLKILFVLYYLLSAIFLFKNVNVFNIDFSIMIVPYVSILSIIYIFTEKLNIKDMKKNIFMVSSYILFFIILIIMFLLYSQSVTDLVTTNLNQMLSKNILLLVLYPIMTVISFYSTYKIYNIIKKSSDVLFINISLTTILIGFIDCILFNIIVNIGIIGLDAAIKLGLGNYLFKIVLSIMFIPVIYYMINRRKSL